jgi:hypothetical protein
MHLINQDWVIRFICGFIIGWCSFGAIALFGFMCCQYRDHKITDPYVNLRLFLGFESPFMSFCVMVIYLFQILAWPLLFKEKYNYEHRIGLGYPLK